MALRKIRQTWYVYYRDGGTIRTKSLRVHTRTEAERLHDLYMEALRVNGASSAEPSPLHPPRFKSPRRPRKRP